LLGGAIGIIGGPLGILAGGSIGALAAKLRDSGFPDNELEALGKTLAPGGSAVVVELAADAVPTAQGVLGALGADHVVVVALDTSVAALFDREQEPEPEPDPAAQITTPEPGQG